MLRAKGSCAGSALAMMVSIVMAQEQPSRPRLAISGGPMYGTAIELLRLPRFRDEVRKELAISEEQAKEIEEAFKPFEELNGDFRESRNLDREDQQKRQQEIFKKGVEESKLAEEKLNRILKSEQRVRWKQLWLQLQGAQVLLQPEVAKGLGLTGEQQDKMREIAASLRPRPGQPKLQDLSQQERQQFFADLNARREKAQLDMLAVLTDEQKAKFSEMKGNEFPFPPQRLGSFSDQPSGQPTKK